MPHLYTCNTCIYSTYDKTSYNKHLSTQKHIHNEKYRKNIVKPNQALNQQDKVQQNTYKCQNCDIVCKSSSGLSKHTNKCSFKLISELKT